MNSCVDGSDWIGWSCGTLVMFKKAEREVAEQQLSLGINTELLLTGFTEDTAGGNALGRVPFEEISTDAFELDRVDLMKRRAILESIGRKMSLESVMRILI